MITVHDVFHGPKLKVEWANHHIITLKNTLNAFVETDFYRVRIDEDVEVKGFKYDPPVDMAEVEVVQDPPREIPLIIGDIVHNLRSALDLAICEMIEGLGGTLHRHTHFPIRDTRQEVIGALENGAIKGAPLDVETVLLEIMRPYKEGNDTLHDLHTLDILDKHRMIIPTFGMFAVILTEGGSPTGPDVFGQSILITPRRGEVKKQLVFRGVKLQSNYKPAIHIFLHDVMRNLPIFPYEDGLMILHRLAREVGENLDTLAKEYVALRNRAHS